MLGSVSTTDLFRVPIFTLQAVHSWPDTLDEQFFVFVFCWFVLMSG